MKYLLVIVLLSSLVFAEKLYARSLRAEWTKSGMVTAMSAAQTMNINGAKAAYKNSVLYIGNNKTAFHLGFPWWDLKMRALPIALVFLIMLPPKTCPNLPMLRADSWRTWQGLVLASLNKTAKILLNSFLRRSAKPKKQENQSPQAANLEFLTCILATQQSKHQMCLIAWLSRAMGCWVKTVGSSIATQSSEKVQPPKAVVIARL